MIITHMPGTNCFYVTESLAAEKAQKLAGIIWGKTCKRGLFIRQLSTWRMVVLLCGLLLAGFGISQVKTENHSILSIGIDTVFFFLSNTVNSYCYYTYRLSSSRGSMVAHGWVKHIQIRIIYASSRQKLSGKRKNYFPFMDLYGILRKTFDIARSRNAQGRFWIRQRDDALRGLVIVYCVADFDRQELGPWRTMCAAAGREMRILRLRCAPLRMTRSVGGARCAPLQGADFIPSLYAEERFFLYHAFFTR